VDSFTRQLEVPGYARMVPLSEISDAKNDFNLNLPRYIESAEMEDSQDIDGHLRGGIPDRDIDALNRYWQVLPCVRPALFESAGRPGYSRLKVPARELMTVILGHAEFAAFNAMVTELFAQWRKTNGPRLNEFKSGAHPKALIEALSEDLLATFGNVPLIDAYDVYQHLLNYWAATMQDDLYLIAYAGWVDAAKPRLVVETKEQNSKEAPDFKIGKQEFKSDLIPAALLIRRYFAAEQAAIDVLEADLSAVDAQLDELTEQHGGEGGLLEETVDGKGKGSKKAVMARLKEIGRDSEDADELDALENYSALVDKQADVKSRLKAARDALEVALITAAGTRIATVPLR